MAEHYIEIEEDLDDIPVEERYRPPEVFRKYVADEKEAEAVYAEAIKTFGTMKVKSKYVEMNHHTDASLNKPCINKDIADGKVAITIIDEQVAK